MPQKILKKTSNFWPSVSKILSKFIPELAQDTFSFIFHVCCFSNNRYEWKKFRGAFIFRVSNQKKKKKNYEFLCFSLLWIKGTKKVSFLWACSVLFFRCSTKKSRLWSQNSLRLTCKVFVFIKHLFKRRDVLHIGCLAEKVINHIVFIWTTKFNLKQVKQKPVEVCITWIVKIFLEFYIFLGNKNINRIYGAMT